LINIKEHRKEFDMYIGYALQYMTEMEVTMAFNMGLRTAVYILERAEELGTEGRRFLIEELIKQIAKPNG
jgi:hypothetical protein